MQSVAPLTASAARLLLRYVQLGGENESMGESMEAIGCRSRSIYFDARAQLKRQGFLSGDGSLNFETMLATPQVVKQVAAVKYEVVTSDEPVAEDNWRIRAMQADLLPGDGEPTQAGSNFQKRRNAQAKVLMDAFKALFGQPLLLTNAKNFLAMTGNYAEDIIDAFEQTLAAPKKIEYPMSYVKAILAKAGQTPQVRAASIDRPAPEPEMDNYFLAKPSDRTARVLAKLQEAGKLMEEDDDDDDD